MIANEILGETVDYLSVRELITNLDNFYDDPLNSYIPVPSAIIIANMYGRRVPMNLIDKYLEETKAWINTLVIELDTLDYSKLIENKFKFNQDSDK